MNYTYRYKRFFSLILVFIIIIVCIIPFVSSSYIKEQTNYESLNIPLNVNWWTMFHNNPFHTGFSESSAPESNDLLWSYSTDFTISSSIVVSHGKVYVGSLDKKVYCFDMINGNLIWDFTANGEITSTPAIENNKIYFGSQDYNLYCLDANSGSLLWAFKTGFMIESSPTIKNGKIYFGSSDGSFYCLNAEDGNLIWNYKTKTVIWSSPALTDNKVYFGDLNGVFYCLDTYDGSLNWKYQTDKGIWSSPTVFDNKVYFGSNDNYIYCLNANNGNYIWSYDTGGEIHSSPAIAYNNVYIGSSFEGLYCLNKDTGGLVWKALFDNGIWSPPSIANGKVYFGTYHCCGVVNYVYCINAYNKEVIWSYDTGSLEGIKSSPAIAAGKVFISLGDGEILAFGDNEDLYADANGPYFSLINTSIHFKGSAYGGEPDYTWFWDFGDGNTSTEQNPTHSYPLIGEYDVILTVSDDENGQSVDQTKAYIEDIPPNNPPTSPIINGPTHGNIGEEYNYTFSSTDIDEDDIFYIVDWGDDSPIDYFGPYASGVELVASHAWTEKGEYNIRCKAKDILNAESEWNNLEVSMPRYRLKYMSLLSWFFKIFSFLEKICL